MGAKGFTLTHSGHEHGALSQIDMGIMHGVVNIVFPNKFIHHLKHCNQADTLETNVLLGLSTHNQRDTQPAYMHVHLHLLEFLIRLL